MCQFISCCIAPPAPRGCEKPSPCAPLPALQAAFCELIGTAAGYGYFKWLIADVSRLQPGDRIPMVEAGELLACAECMQAPDLHPSQQRLWPLRALPSSGWRGRREPSTACPSRLDEHTPVQACPPAAGLLGCLKAPRSLRCPPPMLMVAPLAGQVEPKLARWAAKLLAAYRTALQPRLLVLPALLAAAAAYNAVAGPEGQLGLVEQGCLVGGFLSWKVRLPGAAGTRCQCCGGLGLGGLGLAQQPGNWAGPPLSAAQAGPGPLRCWRAGGAAPPPRARTPLTVLRGPPAGPSAAADP